jgi:hypothetical protein
MTLDKTSPIKRQSKRRQKVIFSRQGKARQGKARHEKGKEEMK